jgi:DNA (cytosine-5)-methyltransferase 1
VPEKKMSMENSRKRSVEKNRKASPRSAASKKQSGSSSPKLRCVDLFAGAGGFSLAASNSGFEVICAVELNKNASKTYRANVSKFGRKTTLYEKNILDLEPSTIKKLHFSKETPCDVVLGGPPCQGFSTHRINGAGVGDPRNALILSYFSFVAHLKPKVFLMENVPGILWPRHKKFLDTFYENGTSAGYNIHEPIIVDARDYGVPQRRKRVFIMGTAKNFIFSKQWPPAPTHGDEQARKINPKLLPWVDSTAIFSTKAPEDDLNSVHMNHTADLIAAFKSTPLNGGSRNESSRVLPCHTGHDGHWDVYGRIDPSQPGPTMTTACINPSKGRFVHPVEHHGITARQAARFQTFPDDFVFHGGLMAAGEQIGNAVPIRLGEVLLKQIKKAITSARLKSTSKAK